jgi:hypothetical protein
MTRQVSPSSLIDSHTHDWIPKIEAVALAPGTSYIDEGDAAAAASVSEGLVAAFRRLGHIVASKPGPSTDIAITHAQFMTAIPWRRSLFFTGRIRYRMPKHAAVFTIVPVAAHVLETRLSEMKGALGELKRQIQENSPVERTAAIDAFRFEGLAPLSHTVLIEQARRAGPLVALARAVQAQCKCIRILLVVHEGTGRAKYVYMFDLVGARPCIDLCDEGAFDDIATRMATAVGASEVTDHVWQGDPIAAEDWNTSESVRALVEASRQLGARGFFAEPVRIADLVKVPVVGRVISEQYSEGCFSTYDPDLRAQIVTGTGSSRAIHKGDVRPHDLAVVTGVRQDFRGAVVRPVASIPKAVPSSEAVELYAIDEALPRIELDLSTSGYSAGESRKERGVSVPVVRSKLHGHCGVKAFDPTKVEHVPLTPPYQRYPVGCGTDAQARALVEAFSRSEALMNPEDSRSVVFSILPGHGCLIVEKWVPRAAPFEAIWRLLDSGGLVIDTSAVPQGPYRYIASGSLQELSER